MANCLAQTAALAFGTGPRERADALGPHRELPGNRPSTVIMAPELIPSVLGQLVALYEHEVLVQGAVWGINSFDQFGVEHGKTLAGEIADDLRSGADDLPTVHHPATGSLIRRYRRLRDGEG